jgi:hypothetical protein
MGDRKPLGVQVQLQAPAYVGVKVRLKLLLDSSYHHRSAETVIRSQLLQALYCFLNPLTGGLEGRGWELGRPVYPTDVVGLVQRQAIPGVRHIGLVELLELRQYGQDWFCSTVAEPVVDPGQTGLICSWEDTDLRSGHEIEFVD